jgi:hypothetical protein
MHGLETHHHFRVSRQQPQHALNLRLEKEDKFLRLLGPFTTWDGK